MLHFNLNGHNLTSTYNSNIIQLGKTTSGSDKANLYIINTSETEGKIANTNNTYQNEINNTKNQSTAINVYHDQTLVVGGSATVNGTTYTSSGKITISSETQATDISKYLGNDSDPSIKITVDGNQKNYYGEGWHKQDKSGDTSTTWVYVVKIDPAPETGDTGKIAATVTGTTTEPNFGLGTGDNATTFVGVPYDYSFEGNTIKFTLNNNTNYLAEYDYDGATNKDSTNHYVSVTTGEGSDAVTKYYTTLNKAVAAAQAGSIVTVIKAIDNRDRNCRQKFDA